MAEATLLEAAPETITADDATPSVGEETAATEALETEALEAAEETEEGEDPLAGLTEEQLKESPAGRKLLEWIEARNKKSADDRVAAATKAQEALVQERLEAQQWDNQRVQAANALGAETMARLKGIAKAIESGQHIDTSGRDLSEAWLGNIVQGLVPAALTASQEASRDIAVKHLQERLPAWKPSQDATARFEASQRSNNLLVRQTGILDYYGTAAYEIAYEAGRAAALKEAESQGKEDAHAESVKTAASTRAGQGADKRPTPVGGAVPRGGFQPKTRLEADKAIEDGRLKLPSVNGRAFYNNLVRGLPYS